MNPRHLPRQTLTAGQSVLVIGAGMVLVAVVCFAVLEALAIVRWLGWML